MRRSETNGPLHVHPQNPRYFADADGTVVYLTGSHTWANLHERAYPHTPPFDYQGYLDFMARFNHNLMRLWAWEQATWMQFTADRVNYSPNRYPRTGPGIALDGLPKFDVSQFDEDFFVRLRTRVEQARERGIYVMVMLFQGFSVAQKGTEGVDPGRGNPWDGHPFNAANNVNGIDGDPEKTGEGYATHTMAIPAITRLQEKYVRKVIDTLNDLDNVIWEISNESHGGSMPWQYHLINLIRAYEQGRAMQHPITMTFCWDNIIAGTNADLFASPAEAISPNGEGGYKDDPPAADGSKVVITDSDHIDPQWAGKVWVWKSFTRGMNPILMDSYHDIRTEVDYPQTPDTARRAMGDTRRYAERMDLVHATPRNDLASTGFCLAQPGVTYLIYQPDADAPFMVTLEPGTYAFEWFDPKTGQVAVAEQRTVTDNVIMCYAPFSGDAVLYINAT